MARKQIRNELTYERAQSIEEQLQYNFVHLVIKSMITILETSNTMTCLRSKSYVDPSRGGVLYVDEESFKHAFKRFLSGIRSVVEYTQELLQAEGINDPWEVIIKRKGGR